MFNLKGTLIIGDLKLRQYVISKTENKNPEGKVFFHFSTPHGKKFEIAKKYHCKAYGKIITPLHLAALLGNAELCKLILDNVTDYNPKSIIFCDQ